MLPGGGVSSRAPHSTARCSSGDADRLAPAEALLRGKSAVRALAISPDGRTLAAAGDDRVIRRWRVGTWEPLPSLEGHERPVWALAFVDDSRLASAGDEPDIRLWDLAAGRVTSRLEGHTGRVRGLAAQPGGLRLVSTSADGAIRIWDPRRGRELLALLDHLAYPLQAAFSPDGRTLATNSMDATIRVRRAENAGTNPIEGLARKTREQTQSKGSRGKRGNKPS